MSNIIEDEKFRAILEAHNGEMRVYVIDAGSVYEVAIDADTKALYRECIGRSTSLCIQPCLVV